jgi:hypothetical protein
MRSCYMRVIHLFLRYPFRLIFISLLVFANCSKEGYLEIGNESGTLIENVKWGDVLEYGDIESGSALEKSTEDHGTYYVYFRKNGHEYVSKKAFTIDAKTSASYVHEDNDDAELLEDQ